MVNDEAIIDSMCGNHPDTALTADPTAKASMARFAE
jgi:hypothetical protein